MHHPPPTHTCDSRYERFSPPPSADAALPRPRSPRRPCEGGEGSATKSVGAAFSAGCGEALPRPRSPSGPCAAESVGAAADAAVCGQSVTRCIPVSPQPSRRGDVLCRRSSGGSRGFRVPAAASKGPLAPPRSAASAAPRPPYPTSPPILTHPSQSCLAPPLPTHTPCWALLTRRRMSPAAAPAGAACAPAPPAGGGGRGGDIVSLATCQHVPTACN